MNTNQSLGLKEAASEATLPRCKATLKRIVKQYASMKRAASYQNRLYNKFDDVKLIDWPRFSEDGRYIWEVSSPKI